MYKLITLALAATAAQASVVLPYNNLGLNAYNGLPLNGLPLNGLPLNGLPVNGLPLNNLAINAYNAPVVAHAPIAPVAASAYALPAPRVVEEAPLVSQRVEKVEQHGYSIRY